MPSAVGDCIGLSKDIIEQNLKLIALVLFALTFSLIIGIIVVANQSNEIAYRLEKEKERVCFTTGCVNRAAIILSNIDNSVDPCEDFYKFACGGFLKKTFIPDDQSSVTAFTTIRNTVYQQIRRILEERPHPDDHRPFLLTKELYNSCINISEIESDGLTSIKEILTSLNGWPLLVGANWSDTKFDWKQLMYSLRNIGYESNCFLTVNVLTDLQNSSKSIISLDQASLELPRELLLRGRTDNLIKIYYDYMIDIAVILGGNRSIIGEEIGEILDLQIEIANISLPYAERRNQTLLYNPMSIRALQKIYPNTNWKQYIKYLLDIPDFEILDDEIINIRVPKYLDDLEDLLNKTSKRVQANYAMWRIVSASIPYLKNELKTRKAKFIKAFSGERQPLPRWKECLFQTLYRFWQPLRSLYDQTHFNKKSKAIATQMVSHIQAEFTKILHETEWMDEKTKKHAIEKAASTKMHIDALETDNNDSLAEKYSRLDFIEAGSYLKKILAVALFNNNDAFRQLRKPVKYDGNKRDISLEYSIFVPGGIFQEVFFDHDQPHYMNYGGIGSLMGHLISHAFDYTGRQFNKDDDLENWWTEETEHAFNEHSKCIIEQYSNYTVPEVYLKVDGRNTRDEIIADNGGIKAAYLAYKTWREHNGPEPQLPGLNYKAEQMFWISSANIFCSKHRNQQLMMIILASRVPPEYYRVIGAVSNSKYFAEDFNCPVGSKMNPKDKCQVW